MSKDYSLWAEAKTKHGLAQVLFCLKNYGADC